MKDMGLLVKHVEQKIAATLSNRFTLMIDGLLNAGTY